MSTGRRLQKWLQINNPAYREVVIDHDALLTLPEDGNIMDFLQTVADNEAPEELTGNELDSVSEANPNLFQCDVPVAGEIGQADQIFHQLNRNDLDHPIQWLNTKRTAINEFNSKYYVARAFPALFPWGRAD